MKSPLEGTVHPDFIAPEIPGFIHICNCSHETDITVAMVNSGQFFDISQSELWAEPFRDGIAVYAIDRHYGLVKQKIERASAMIQDLAVFSDEEILRALNEFDK